MPRVPGDSCSISNRVVTETVRNSDMGSVRTNRRCYMRGPAASRLVIRHFHVTVSYSLRYDAVEIEQLSPGTRGIVLFTSLRCGRYRRRPATDN